jgi:hypothetical protein
MIVVKAEEVRNNRLGRIELRRIAARRDLGDITGRGDAIGE